MRSYKRGFTFLEVLAALVIMSVALVPIMIWVPVSLQTKLKSERKTTAIFLAQSKIEELRFRIIQNYSGDYYNADPNAFDPPYQDFRYTATGDSNPELKTISVKVWHIENPKDETAFYTQIARR